MTQSIKLVFSLVALRRIDLVVSDDLGPNLPWDNLIDRLSVNATLLQATSNQDYVVECYPEYKKASENRSLTTLENQPSGLCLHALSCAFENCAPYKSDPVGVEEWIDPSNPLYNVPSSVIFPAVAGDVVAVVEFATDNGLELSVKNSGHNQAGASSKKDTLLVNTQRYAEYASNGIVECSDIDENVINQDLSNQACLMALARDKNAFIRVGGGENFGDVYGSVRAFNEAQESFKYHAVGGAVSTVTPMGWTFQGGLGGTTGGRMYGFGVDQVLQIEAVLPNGQHVRFGPTSWENKEDFLYPKTTAVSGVCNTNPREEEANWIWGTCPTEINFDDLWFAFLGGGGGTWGIVTSIYLQLHDYLSLEYVTFPTTPDFARFMFPQFCNIPAEEVTEGIVELAIQFVYDYMLDPSSLGVSEAESTACASPDSIILPCYGEGMGRKFASTWKAHVLDRKQELLDNDTSEESIENLANCLTIRQAKDVFESFETEPDAPPPGFFNWGADEDINGDAFNVLVPLSFYQNEKEAFFELMKNGSFTTPPYFAHTGKATDQTSSLSKAHYGAGFQTSMSNAEAAEFLKLAYSVSSTDTSIPAHIGGNHYLTRMYGPLKSDPTMPCDALGVVSFEEADEKCFPTQAAVWGENLTRLEAIKKEIDPSGIFNCNKCVGNNKAKGIELPPEEESNSSGAPAEPAEDIDVSEVPIEPTEDSDSSKESAKPKPNDEDIYGSGAPVEPAKDIDASEVPIISIEDSDSSEEPAKPNDGSGEVGGFVSQQNFVIPVFIFVLFAVIL